MSTPKPTFPELVPDYAKLWNTVAINAGRVQKTKAIADALQANKDRYVSVSDETKVPWFVVGLIHSLEADFSFKTHLHNGDPLGKPTRHEPADRPLTPPFNDWLHSAVDALSMKGLQNVGALDWTIERIAYELERYNGMGYRTNKLSVLSPYLWSFTNHYTKGKYVKDHVYDPNFVSEQAGAMAILKHMVENGLSVGVQGPVGPPPPPPPPVPTGKFEVDARPFLLRDSVGAEATDNSLPVMRDNPIEKLNDTADAAWWKIRVQFGVGPDVDGFAKREWIRPVLVPQAIRGEMFAKSCLDAARRYGTSAHFLIALADAESGTTNKAFEGAPFGPFAMTAEDWSTNNNKAETGSGDMDRFDPYAQTAVAARLTVKLTDDIRSELPDKRLPTSEELYLGRILTPMGLRATSAAKDTSVVRSALAATLPPADLGAIFALRPTLLTSAITVKGLRGEVVKRLEAGFSKAVKLILMVEPDFVVGPPETVDEQREVPWMVKAKKQRDKPVEELPGKPSNPDIEKYFTATTLGKQSDDVAWCAAFVSWCVRQAGGSSKHVNFSARAADWLSNGDQLAGPQYGAIAITKPMVAKSSGHVGFVIAWDATRVKLLAGNQANAMGRDAVCEKDFKIADVRGWRMI